MSSNHSTKRKVFVTVDRGEKARKRIIDEYSIATIAERYRKLYNEVTERVRN